MPWRPPGPGGTLQLVQPHAFLSALALLVDSIHPGDGVWVFRTSPCSSSQCFLNFYLMQGGETTQVSKGRSPWGTELLGRWQALPLSPRVMCRPSWAVEEQL